MRLKFATLIAGCTLIAGFAAFAAPPKKGGLSVPPTPDPKSPMKCDKCEYACLFADQIAQAERNDFLYANIGPIAKNASALENQVKDLSKQWVKRDDQNQQGASAFNCYRSIDAKAKTDEEVNAVYQDANKVSGEAMTTDWNTADCTIDTKGLESKVCAGLYNTMLAHELSHQKSCREAWAKVGAKAKNVQTNTKLRMYEEMRAYREQMLHAEREMKRLVKKGGCGFKTSGRRLAPPPTEKEIIDARKDIEAIPSIMRAGK